MICFRTQGKDFILSLVKQRKYLISTGKSQAKILPSEIENLEDQLSRRFSDNSIAWLFIEFYDLLKRLCPATNNNRQHQITIYHNEAKIYLNL